MFTKLIDFVKKAIAKIKSLSGGTILRTILLMLVYINQLVALIGSTVMVFAENPISQKPMPHLRTWQNHPLTQSRPRTAPTLQPAEG